MFFVIVVTSNITSTIYIFWGDSDTDISCLNVKKHVSYSFKVTLLALRPTFWPTKKAAKQMRCVFFKENDFSTIWGPYFEISWRNTLGLSMCLLYQFLFLCFSYFCLNSCMCDDFHSPGAMFFLIFCWGLSHENRKNTLRSSQMIFCIKWGFSW